MLRRSFEPRQYAAGEYHNILQSAAITQSMSRKGNCWDNAPVESFFGTLKTELVYREYPDRDNARSDLFAYIEGYYNRRRIHSAIGYITPQQAEAKGCLTRCPLFRGEVSPDRRRTDVPVAGVDPEGKVLDMLVQRRRDSRAALRLMRVMSKQCWWTASNAYR